MMHTLSDDDDDTDEGEQGSDGNLDKRGRRSWAREAKQKLSEYETKFAEMSEKLAALEGRSSQQPVVYQQPTQRQEPADPYAQKLSDIDKRMDTIMRTSQTVDLKRVTQEQLDEMTREYRALQDQRHELVTERVLSRNGGGRQQQPDYAVMQIQAEYPEIYQRPDLYHEANAEFARLMAKAGNRHGGLPMMREAAENVFKRNGIRQKAPAPTKEQQAKMAGTSSRAGASGQGGTQVPYTKRDFSDAQAYFAGATGKYANWTEKQRFDYWYKNVKTKGA
jgi:hypothetical protein